MRDRKHFLQAHNPMFFAVGDGKPEKSLPGLIIYQQKLFILIVLSQALFHYHVYTQVN